MRWTKKKRISHCWCLLQLLNILTYWNVSGNTREILMCVAYIFVNRIQWRLPSIHLHTMWVYIFVNNIINCTHQLSLYFLHLLFELGAEEQSWLHSISFHHWRNRAGVFSSNTFIAAKFEWMCVVFAIGSRFGILAGAFRPSPFVATHFY